MVNHIDPKGVQFQWTYLWCMCCVRTHTCRKCTLLNTKNQQTTYMHKKAKKPVDQVKTNVWLSINICVAAYIKGNPYKLLNSVDSNGKLFICSKILHLAVSNPGYDDLPLIVFSCGLEIKNSGIWDKLQSCTM